MNELIERKEGERTEELVKKRKKNYSYTK